MLKDKMKKLWQERETRGFLILSIVIAALLGFGPFFSKKNPLTQLDNRVLVSFFLILGWALLNWWYLVQSQITSKSRSVSHEDGDALYVACDNVKKNVAAAVNFLKERLRKSFTVRKAFEQLPWYLVIGNPRSGKTCLLAQSALGFLATEQFVQFSPENMSTSGQVNWWLSPSAVLIDVPGHYLAHDESFTPSRAAWFELLHQIKRYRRHQPLHGIIITLDIKAILSSSSAKEDSLSQLINGRLQEIVYRLKQPLPLYVICSQMDKVQGFREFFDDLGKEEREQHWGISFPLTTKTNKPAFFEKAFDSFILNLHQRALWRIHQERERTKKSMIQQFPYQLSYMKDNLRHFVSQFCLYREQLSLRGIFFTGVESQEISTINKIGETVSEQFSLIPTKQLNTTLRQPQVFFIKEIFNKKIFPEARLIKTFFEPTTSQQHDFLKFILLGLSGALVISGVVFGSQYYKTQTQHLHTATIALSDYKLLSLTYNKDTLTLTKLLPALNALRLAKENATQANLPWLLRFQLHHQQPLVTSITQLYDQTLQIDLIPLIREQLAQQLNEGMNNDPTRFYKLLKVYLMLGDPTHVNKDFLQHWFKYEDKSIALKNPQIKAHIETALANQLTIMPADAMVVTEARSSLNALPYETLSKAIFYNDLPTDMVGPLITEEKQKHFFMIPSSIPTCYTKNFLAQADIKINDAIKASLNGNEVLGEKSSIETSEENIDALRDTLMNDYAEHYNQAWQQWLQRIHLQNFASLSQLDLALQELTSKASLLRPIITTVEENTAMIGFDFNDHKLLTVLRNHLMPSFEAFNNLAQTNLSSQFNLKVLVSALQQYQQAIHTVTRAKEKGQMALNLLQNSLNQDSKNDAIRNLNALTKNAPWPLNEWLTQLSDNGQTLLLVQAQHFLAQAWQKTVYTFYQQKIANRFPVEPAARENIALEDFQAFFAKEGILDHFVNTHFISFIDTSQTTWAWRPLSHHQVLIKNPNILLELERANVIQHLYFDKKNQLNAKFKLQFISASPSVKKVQLTIDNQLISKSLEKNALPLFAWPTDGHSLHLSITDQTHKVYTLEKKGPWSLFEFMAAGQSSFHDPDKTSYDLLFQFNDSKILYRLIPDSPLNPFIPKIIDQFYLQPLDA